jgi:hypothetical protein
MGVWAFTKSSAGRASQTVAFGATDDVPLPGDYDSDGKADLILWRAFTATWHALTSASAYTQAASWTWGAPAATCTPNLAVSGAPPASPPITAMWQATGVTVTAGQTTSVTASGTWTSGSAFTADGDPNTIVTGDNCPLSGAHLMALVKPACGLWLAACGLARHPLRSDRVILPQPPSPCSGAS